ncbi:hypothetical protein WH47_01901 [Habropoda laboriosa]|uniref:Uncharacterized protein n=1 Tax=Habropoda laboriosa TaxID=597456 RepID=A0A0L7QXS0_9HYME|nr:hypothetical protein WH47_01901 [Habropoda laboriosa]
MSEENEHTSEDTEAEMNTENHSKQQSKSETSMLNNETEQPMLEDEEMPTYISVSSPSRREDSDVNNTKQQDRIPIEEDHSRSPYPSDDQGGGSIYVLSSGEETTHGYNDEEDDEYADSDDMDEMDLENDHDNVMLEGEEEEDEDDDEEENPLRLHHDDFEDDIDYEPECFDRVSDDFVLNTRLKHHPKERSLSLQDLSITKTFGLSPFNRKRHSIFRYNYSNMQHNQVENLVTNKKQAVPHKYQHVESKVKQYIKDIKEQNRKSIEKRVKEQEILMSKNHEENENKDTEQLKAKVTKQAIKDYAEEAIKDLQREETEDDNVNYNTAQIVENGENNKTSNRGIESQYKLIRKDTEYNDIQSEKRTQNCDDKIEKRNGSVDINKHHIEYQNTIDRNVKFGNINQSSLVNGHQQTPTFINLRTLSYEEYMHDTSNTEQGEESEEKPEKNESEEYNDTEMINAQEIDNSNTSCPLKIENVKSIRITQDESENLTFGKINPTIRINAENSEIIQLKAQLTKKDEQFHNLRDVYQKTLAENIKMKQELDALKKSLAKYEDESKTCETKIASVQTEAIVESSTSNKGTTSSGEGNKVSTSSVASTVSSVDPWAESSYSPAISIKPPDLTPILNSDDSIVLTDGITPRKIAHPISRTFITSSRILQTLSNITQGKTKVESPLVKHTSQKRLNENSANQLLNLAYNSPMHASSSKKRKATEMLGPSTFVQPFKIPHTSIELERKNSIDATEVSFKYSEENTSSKSEQEEKNTSVNKNINDSKSIEAKMGEAEDNEDSVKCFIYRDDENSKNKSFLIQAEEPTKNRLNDEKNRIQECGPYLLGNLEVRMSEINGTISVWGKEISHESVSDNEDDMEVSIKSPEKQTCHCWPNITSQTRFNGSPFMCSTNKKQKIPSKFNRSNISQCSHNLSLHSVKASSFVDDISDKRHKDNCLSPDTCVPCCEKYDSSKYHNKWSPCKNVPSPQEKLHSCCTHHTEFIDKECNCGSYHEKQKYDSPKCFKDKFHNKGIRRNSYKNTFTPDSKNHLHGNITNAAAEMSEVICKYHTTCRHSLQNVMNSSSHSKCCNTIKDISCVCKSSSDNINNHENFDIHSSNHNFSNNDEEDPLILHKRSNETSEVR